MKLNPKPAIYKDCGKILLMAYEGHPKKSGIFGVSAPQRPKYTEYYAKVLSDDYDPIALSTRDQDLESLNQLLAVFTQLTYREATASCDVEVLNRMMVLLNSSDPDGNRRAWIERIEALNSKNGSEDQEWVNLVNELAIRAIELQIVP